MPSMPKAALAIHFISFRFSRVKRPYAAYSPIIYYK